MQGVAILQDTTLVKQIIVSTILLDKFLHCLLHWLQCKLYTLLCSIDLNVGLKMYVDVGAWTVLDNILEIKFNPCDISTWHHELQLVKTIIWSSMHYYYNYIKALILPARFCTVQ